MKSFFTKLIVSVLILINVSCAPKTIAGQYRGYETPEYKVIEKKDNIEIRNYEKYLVAEVEVEGNRKEAAKKGFWILAKYIFGKNAAQEKMAMTSPVAQIASDAAEIAKSQKWLVQFKMPKKYSLQTLPKPINQEIKFKEIKVKKAIAITFAGFWCDEKFVKNKEKLKEFAQTNNLELINQPIISYYDDPFTLPWNRRNEIIWEIKN